MSHTQMIIRTCSHPPSDTLVDVYDNVVVQVESLVRGTYTSSTAAMKEFQ